MSMQSVYEATGVRMITCCTHGREGQIRIDCTSIPALQDPWQSIALEAMALDPEGAWNYIRAIQRRADPGTNVVRLAVQSLSSGLHNSADTALHHPDSDVLTLAVDPWYISYNLATSAILMEKHRKETRK